MLLYDYYYYYGSMKIQTQKHYSKKQWQKPLGCPRENLITLQLSYLSDISFLLLYPMPGAYLFITFFPDQAEKLFQLAPTS